MNIPEITAKDLDCAISRRLRDQLSDGRLNEGADVAVLRRFSRLSQPRFAAALGISVHTLRNWEQSRRTPEGPARALLRIVARHPAVVHENLT